MKGMNLGMKVGIFDSGVGGLTVLKTLLKKYPNNEYIYYGDTLNIPYGNKSISELYKLSSKIIEFLISNKVDIIVIACGTISSNCIDYLKEKYKIPIYDIISPVINYLNNSNYQNIGIIATSNTINSHYFKNNLKKNTYEIASPKLVPIIESNNLSNLENVLDEYLVLYKNKIDLLVLGCTHYPIIKKYIDKYFNYKIPILDMSEYISLSNGTNNSLKLYFTKLDDTVINNIKSILVLSNIDIYKIDE